MSLRTIAKRRLLVSSFSALLKRPRERRQGLRPGSPWGYGALRSPDSYGWHCTTQKYEIKASFTE